VRPSAPPAEEEDLGLPAGGGDGASTTPTGDATSYTKHKQPGFFGKIGQFFKSDRVNLLSNEQQREGMVWGAVFAVEEGEVPAIVAEWMANLWLLPGDLEPAKCELGPIERVFLPFHSFHVSTVTRYDGKATIRKKEGDRARDLMLPGGRLQSSYYHLVLAQRYDDAKLRKLTEEMHIGGSELELLPPVIEAQDIAPVAQTFAQHVEGKIESAEERRALLALRQRCGVRANVLSAQITSLNINKEYKSSLACVPFFITSFQYGGERFTVLINGVSGMAVGERPYGGGAFTKLAKLAYEGVRSFGQWLGLVPESSNNNNNE